ncbi:MAG TPA: hypothetical protein VKF81_02195 [Blastocatellia bacterium]|nr:hypothetical protein [Blastocatellia bacterium]
MKKTKTKNRTGDGKARRIAKPKEVSKSQSAPDTSLATDIRKAYKNRLLRDYFNRSR